MSLKSPRAVARGGVIMKQVALYVLQDAGSVVEQEATFLLSVSVQNITTVASHACCVLSD